MPSTWSPPPWGPPPLYPGSYSCAGGGFLFGSPPASSTAAASFGTPASSAGLFGMASPPAVGFGGAGSAVAGTPGFGAPASSAAAGRLSFGAPASAAAPAAGGFSFGEFGFEHHHLQALSAKLGHGQQQQQHAMPQPIQFGSWSLHRMAHEHKPTAFVAAGQEGDGVELGGAAKAAALANLAEFRGGGIGPGLATTLAGPPALPPRTSKHSGASAAFAAVGLDAEEEEEKKRLRASRFGQPVPTTLWQPQQPAHSAPWTRPSTTDSASMMDGEAVVAVDDPFFCAIQGICIEMCPAIERERRSRLNDIQIFERPVPDNSALTTAELAVKRFARTIDDSNNAPEFFRTREALCRTMAHLRKLLDRQDARLGLIHKFLWDRYRSVRQDLYIQGMDDEFSVNIYEEIVRFHLLSEHELCEEEASVTEMEGFDSHLNMEQMNKALISLNDMYNKLAAAGRPARCEAEFRAYHLLSLMGQHGKFKGDQQAFLSMLQTMRPDVRGAPPVQWVLKLQRAFSSSNFVRFFGLVREAPYLLACLSHIYFGQIRGRALRTLGGTLAPNADVPVALELSWLVRVLMLGSDQQAEHLCAMHGFKISTKGSTPVVLLVKGAYIDPPPPVPRKRSKLVTSIAPATRSLAVTTPCLPPMSGEAALLEQQQHIQLLRHNEEQACHAQQATEQMRQEALNAAGAAAEKTRTEEDARQAAQARRHDQDLARQHEAQLAAQQVALLQLQEEQRLQQDEEVKERQELEEWQRLEQERHAAAAEQCRLEEARRHKAAEVARQRAAELERFELERLRLEQLKQLQQEKQCARRNAKRIWAVQHFFLARWRIEAHRRIEERRQRQQQLAIHLKACKVGMSSEVDTAEEEAAGAAEALANGSSQLLSTMAVTVASTEPIDLPSLAAPLLLQRSPAATTLYWKVVLARPQHLHVGGNRSQVEQLQHLQNWLALQLQQGKPARMPGCTAFVEGPVVMQTTANSGTTTTAKLAICFPDSDDAASNTLAGASGIIMAVSSSSFAHWHWMLQPSRMATALPTLLVAASDAAAQVWQQHISRTGSPSEGTVHVVSVQETATAAGAGSTSRAAGIPQLTGRVIYSRRRLVQGLSWLAAHSPSQPTLKIVPLEALMRTALGATSTPLLRLPAGLVDGLPAAQLVCSALEEAIALVEQLAVQSQRSAAAVWQWPPPELAPAALRCWYDIASLRMVKSWLQKPRTDASTLLRMAEGRGQHALMVAAHMQLAMLGAAGVPPLVLSPDVDQWFDQQLNAAKALPLLVMRHAALVATMQQPGSSNLRQKRKWQTATSPMVPSKTRQSLTTMAPACSWAAVVPAGGHAMQPAALGPTSPSKHFGEQQASAMSRIPSWRRLNEALLSEKHQALGLQEHAVLAAAGKELMPPILFSELDGSDRQGPLTGKTLEQLQEVAMAEHAANELLCLALK